ncbi:transposase [Mastigocoleus testarum]|uniref:transposase n=1 Tax=Mastigocoleus testarum TaxID=996925 RepID=UPI0013797D06|nr:transposase [Mastigocoleus testarum]
MAKNLYNYANYLIRQSFIFEEKYLNYNAMEKLCQVSGDYKALPAKVAQQILMRLHEAWQGFFSSLASYKDTGGCSSPNEDYSSQINFIVDVIFDYKIYNYLSTHINFSLHKPIGSCIRFIPITPLLFFYFFIKTCCLPELQP